MANDPKLFVPPPPSVRSPPPTIPGLSIAQLQHEAEQESMRKSSMAPGLDEVLSAAYEGATPAPAPRKEEAAEKEADLPDVPGPDEHICARCKTVRINALTDMQPTQAEKDAYWQHVLGFEGLRFTRTYKGLFGGRFSVKLRTRTVDETEALAELFRKEMDVMTPAWRLSQSNDQLTYRKTRLMLAASLEEVQMRATKDADPVVVQYPELPSLTEGAILARVRDIQKRFPAEVTFRAFTNCLEHFDSFCRLLGARAADPSFFGEIDAGS